MRLSFFVFFFHLFFVFHVSVYGVLSTSFTTDEAQSKWCHLMLFLQTLLVGFHCLPSRRLASTECLVDSDLCQVNTNPLQRSLTAACALTCSLSILYTDRTYFLLWESSLPGPLQCYRWRAGLWHCLWPASSIVVMCKMCLPALAWLWGAALPAGQGVRMMIAFWPLLVSPLHP